MENKQKEKLKKKFIKNLKRQPDMRKYNKYKKKLDKHTKVQATQQTQVPIEDLEEIASDNFYIFVAEHMHANNLISSIVNVICRG